MDQIKTTLAKTTQDIEKQQKHVRQKCCTSLLDMFLQNSLGGCVLFPTQHVDLRNHFVNKLFVQYFLILTLSVHLLEYCRYLVSNTRCGY